MYTGHTSTLELQLQYKQFD